MIVRKLTLISWI